MRKKTAKELKLSGNLIAARQRATEETQSGYGEPLRPAGLPRNARRAWNRMLERYSAVLLRSDSEILLELIDSGTGRRRAKQIESIFAARKPAPKVEQEPEHNVEHEPEQISLQDFLASTNRARDTFSERLIAGQTMMLDADGPFTWDPSDPTTRAREYAQQCSQGAIAACDLTIRCCNRFLDDLEHGHERGVYYDSVAAHQVIEFFTVFLKRPPFKWQLLVLCNLFGFRLPSGLRRFKESWCWISRQNGKTALNAGIGNFILICDGEPVSEIYAAANTGDQSKITFRDAKRLVKNHPQLKEYVKVYRSALTVEDTDACFLALASETSSLDGLRPACLLADEIHEWDAAVGGRELWSKLTSGMVSRRHPLTLAISTAGGRQMGFAWEKFEMVKKILQKIIVADDIFCCAWELDPTDDYQDEKLWIKANPSLADEKGLTLDSLRRQYRETQADPSSLSSFLRYQAGRWQEFKRTSATFPFTIIDKSCGYPDMKNADAKQLYSHFLQCNGDKPSYAGFDWGEVSDLACFTLLYPRVTLANGDTLEKKVMISEFWTPGALVQQHMKEWGVPLEQWIKEGWVRTCDGDINSPVQLKKDLLDILNAKQVPSGFPVFNIRSIGYDPWHSRAFMTAFSEETAVQCVEVSQKPSTLTPVAVAFKAALLAGNIWHLGNPVVRWMLSNVILEREGKYDAVVPCKPNKHAKIDAVQAGLNAWLGMELGASTERAPRIHFFMGDNSVLASGADGHLTEKFGPLVESSKGPVNNDV